MKNFGTKDIDRMNSIREKSRGDYMKQLMFAYNMSCAITEPGKAMARGYAAQEVFGEQAAIAQIFFERAYDISGGRDVRPAASENPYSEEVEEEYDNIPLNEQPASRRPEHEVKFWVEGQNPKTPFSHLDYRGKLNVIRGETPDFKLYNYSVGTIEVWKTEEGRPRLIFTSNYEPNYGIGIKRQFRYDGKVVEWEMVDYIEMEYVGNLAPIYGKSIPVYCYD